MAIPASTTLYTQALSMQGANAALATFVIFTLGGASSVTPTLEGSNDMVNWTTITAYSAISSAGYQVASATSTDIAWQYARLKLVAASGGTVILSADVSTALL
jgi:hypothetical protein